MQKNVSLNYCAQFTRNSQYKQYFYNTFVLQQIENYNFLKF